MKPSIVSIVVEVSAHSLITVDSVFFSICLRSYLAVSLSFQSVFEPDIDRSGSINDVSEPPSGGCDVEILQFLFNFIISRFHPDLIL